MDIHQQKCRTSLARAYIGDFSMCMGVYCTHLLPTCRSTAHGRQRVCFSLRNTSHTFLGERGDYTKRETKSRDSSHLASGALLQHMMRRARSWPLHAALVAIRMGGGVCRTHLPIGGAHRRRHIRFRSTGATLRHRHIARRHLRRAFRPGALGVVGVHVDRRRLRQLRLFWANVVGDAAGFRCLFWCSSSGLLVWLCLGILGRVARHQFEGVFAYTHAPKMELILWNGKYVFS